MRLTLASSVRSITPALPGSPLLSLRLPEAAHDASTQRAFPKQKFPKVILLVCSQGRSINVTGFLHCYPKHGALPASPRWHGYDFLCASCGHFYSRESDADSKGGRSRWCSFLFKKSTVLRGWIRVTFYLQASLVC